MKKTIEKRFGTVAVERGLITKGQLVEALAIQARENVEDGTHRLLGQILIELGYLNNAGLEEILDELSHSVICTLAMGR